MSQIVNQASLSVKRAAPRKPKMSHALFGLLPPQARAHRQSRLDASLAEGGAEACLRRRSLSAAGTGSPRPITSPSSTASPMSPCWRRAISAPAISGATPPSFARTICCRATPPFYERSMKLWEGLSQELNFNTMVSQRGILNVFHSDPQRNAYVRRGNAMRLSGVDAELLTRDQVREYLPFADFDNARFPIRGALMQPRGGTVRHDAVAWGYARAADERGVDIIENCEVTGFRIEQGRIKGVETNRGFIGAPESRACRRRQHVARRRARGPAATDRGARDPGLRHRGHQAADRSCGDVRRRPFLCQPVGQRRPRVRRRSRRLQFLRPARQSAGGRGRGRGRACALPQSRAAAHPAELGRTARHVDGRLADLRQDRHRRALSQLRLVLRRLQSDAGVRRGLRPSDRQGRAERSDPPFRLDRYRKARFSTRRAWARRPICIRGGDADQMSLLR